VAIFEVHYSFTCTSCKKPNSDWMAVEAAHEVEALSSAHGLACCSSCEAALEPEQRLTTTMKRIG